MLGLNFVLFPGVETTPSPYPGDSVDDAAIWYDADHPDQSVVLTTLKASNLRPVQPTGILVYDLAGQQLQFLKGGTPNNIDLRPSFPDGDQNFTLIAASHWYTEEVGLYRFDPEARRLSLLKLFPTGVRALRGLCMAVYHDKFYYFAVGSSGDIEQYRIISPNEVKLEQRWELSSVAEGCVADETNGHLYVSEEKVGIQKLPLNPQVNAAPELVESVSFFGPLKKGLEGMAILTHESQRFLIVSVQEKSRFAIYRLPDETYLGSFKIKSKGDIDGVTKTDGIAIFNQPIGSAFPEGLIVVQDDTNQSKTEKKSLNQNFKFVSRKQLTDALETIKQ